MFTKTFWIAAVENTVKAFAAACLSAIVAAGTDIIHTNWWNVLSIGGMAAVVYLLTTLSSGAINGTTTFTNEPGGSNAQNKALAAPAAPSAPTAPPTTGA